MFHHKQSQLLVAPSECLGAHSLAFIVQADCACLFCWKNSDFVLNSSFVQFEDLTFQSLVSGRATICATRPNTKMMFLTPSLLVLLSTSAKVTELYRYAVKGLSGDTLQKVVLTEAGQCFPDDRRYGLLHASKQFKEEYLTKDNFLCAFTAPELLATIQSSYQVVLPHTDTNDHPLALPCDRYCEDRTLRTTSRSLLLRDRNTNKRLSKEPLRLETEEGRNELARLLSTLSGQSVACITSSKDKDKDKDKHTFQFGNTSSGVKRSGDTRTIHIINQETIADFSQAVGIPLNPSRFRPNIVVSGIPAWSEFDWIDKTISCSSSGVKMAIISKTVRCRGVSVDPLDPHTVLDIPALLVGHFPQYGPYLGVYAVLESPGSISIGDGFHLDEPIEA